MTNTINYFRQFNLRHRINSILNTSIEMQTLYLREIVKVVRLAIIQIFDYNLMEVNSQCELIGNIIVLIQIRQIINIQTCKRPLDIGVLICFDNILPSDNKRTKKMMR